MKFEITDKREYITTHWYIESENDTYNVICQEGDLEDEWFISSDEEGELDRYSEIAKELISMCSSDDSKPSDY
jgi:hypothetical protein